MNIGVHKAWNSIQLIQAITAKIFFKRPENSITMESLQSPARTTWEPFNNDSLDPIWKVAQDRKQFSHAIKHLQITKGVRENQEVSEIFTIKQNYKNSLLEMFTQGVTEPSLALPLSGLGFSGSWRSVPASLLHIPLLIFWMGLLFTGK